MKEFLEVFFLPGRKRSVVAQEAPRGGVRKEKTVTAVIYIWFAYLGFAEDDFLLALLKVL